MHLEVDFSAFCKQYYRYACNVAEKKIAYFIKKYGDSNPYIDPAIVRDNAVFDALEKTYLNFDVDHESEASINTFLYTVVSNCVYSELPKFTKGSGGNIRSYAKPDITQYREFKDLINDFADEKKYETKEMLIMEMLDNMKKLNPVNQVILSCYMLYPKSEYTDKSLEQLGWENTPRSRNLVQLKCFQSIESLRKKMQKSIDDNINIFNEPQKATIRKINKPIIDSALREEQNRKRRHQIAATKNITRNIDFDALAKTLATIATE